MKSVCEDEIVPVEHILRIYDYIRLGKDKYLKKSHNNVSYWYNERD